MQTINEIKIKKIHTLKDLVISALVLAAGVGVYFVSHGWGVLFCLIGVLLFAYYKGAFRRVGDRTVLREKSSDVDVECRPALIDFLEGRSDEVELRAPGEGDSLWLDVYYNADAAVAYAQLFDVSENKFEPATGIVELHGARANKLIL